jgi:hypothetical protein
VSEEFRPAADAHGVDGSDDAVDSGTRGLAVGAIAGGWLLFLIVGPLAVFLTWFGDCPADSCPVASDIDRAIYTADLVAWLAVPGLAFLAHRGWRPAAVVLAGFGAFIVAQGVAAVLGARGFQAFFLVFPPGGLIAIGGVLGILGPWIRASTSPTRPRRRPPPRSRPQGRGPA